MTLRALALVTPSTLPTNEPIPPLSSSSKTPNYTPIIIVACIGFTLLFAGLIFGLLWHGRRKAMRRQQQQQVEMGNIVKPSNDARQPSFLALPGPASEVPISSPTPTPTPDPTPTLLPEIAITPPSDSEFQFPRTAIARADYHYQCEEDGQGKVVKEGTKVAILGSASGEFLRKAKRERWER